MGRHDRRARPIRATGGRRCCLCQCCGRPSIHSVPFRCCRLGNNARRRRHDCLSDQNHIRDVLAGPRLLHVGYQFDEHRRADPLSYRCRNSGHRLRCRRLRPVCRSRHQCRGYTHRSGKRSRLHITCRINPAVRSSTMTRLLCHSVTALSRLKLVASPNYFTA